MESLSISWSESFSVPSWSSLILHTLIQETRSFRTRVAYSPLACTAFEAEMVFSLFRWGSWSSAS